MKTPQGKEASMKIIYSNKKTEKVCENFTKATKEYGKDVATRLFDLLNLIESFPTLLDLIGMPQYRLHSLSGNREYQYSFVIHKGYKWRLIVYPLDENEKILTDKSNEREMLSKAVMVEVLEVSEHYD